MSPRSPQTTPASVSPLCYSRTNLMSSCFCLEFLFPVVVWQWVPMVPDSSQAGPGLCFVGLQQLTACRPRPAARWRQLSQLSQHLRRGWGVECVVAPQMFCFPPLISIRCPRSGVQDLMSASPVFADSEQSWELIVTCQAAPTPRWDFVLGLGWGCSLGPDLKFTFKFQPWIRMNWVTKPQW